MPDWKLAINDTIAHWGSIYVSIAEPHREDVSTYDLLKNTASCPMCLAVAGDCSKCIVPTYMVVVLRQQVTGSKPCLNISELRAFYKVIAAREDAGEVLSRLKPLLSLAVRFRYWLDTGYDREVFIEDVSIRRHGKASERMVGIPAIENR